MSSPDISFGGSVAAQYDRHLVPMLFSDYARSLAAWVVLPRRAEILEIAAGTGALTRELCANHGSARIVATDLNPTMLARAEERLAGREELSFRAADGTALPFESDRFDAVFCQFGVMFYSDRVQGYREAARVLKPGGHFAFNVWGSLASNPLPQLVNDTVRAMFPDDPPAFLELPFGYFDEQRIHDELTQAGFGSIWSERQLRVCRVPSARAVVDGLVDGSPLGATLDEMGAKSDAMAEVERRVIERYGSGSIAAPMEAIAIHAQARD